MNLKQLDTRINPDGMCTNEFNAGHELCVYSTTTQTACHGDSGGPMVQKVGAEWRLLGATSRAGVNNQTCGAGQATIYTDVVAFKQWIQSTTGGGGGNPPGCSVAEWSPSEHYPPGSSVAPSDVRGAVRGPFGFRTDANASPDGNCAGRTRWSLAGGRQLVAGRRPKTGGAAWGSVHRWPSMRYYLEYGVAFTEDDRGRSGRSSAELRNVPRRATG